MCGALGMLSFCISSYMFGVHVLHRHCMRYMCWDCGV